jgi:DNA polymerase III delta prime subunit
MQQLTDSYIQTQNLHHAYLVEGRSEVCVSELTDFFANTVQLKTRGNPNFIIEQRDTFLIEDARRLRELQLNKTQVGGKKVFIMSFNFITSGAQNALLKVLEEPTSGTHIFLITPRKQIFLPTVLSRVEIITEQKDGVARTDGKKGGAQNKVSKDTEKFLQDSYKDRMKFITALVKKIKDEKKSKADAIMLLEEIIINLETELVHAEHKKFFAAKLTQLQKIHSYMQNQGASLKMLLEQAALLV